MPTIAGVLQDTEVFLLSFMRYINVNEASICGEAPTLYGTHLFGSNNPCTGVVRRDSLIQNKEALTAATTGGNDQMKRCHYKMRSVLGDADTLKSAGCSPGVRNISYTALCGKMGKTKKTHLQKISLKNTEVRHTMPKCDVYQDIYTLNDNEVLYIKQDYFKIIIKEKYNTPVTYLLVKVGTDIEMV